MLLINNYRVDLLNFNTQIYSIYHGSIMTQNFQQNTDPIQS